MKTNVYHIRLVQNTKYQIFVIIYFVLFTHLHPDLFFDLRADHFVQE